VREKTDAPPRRTSLKRSREVNAILRSIGDARLKKRIRKILRDGGPFVAAISPAGNFYQDHATLPTIKAPNFLMVKGPFILADGWVIRFMPTQSCLEFLSRHMEAWNDKTSETKQQLDAFLEALQRLVISEEV
jgi:hypothetical protein